MTEAMEAMSVPHPPALTPLSSSVAFPVNCASNRVAGTLLMSWLASSDTKNSLPSNSLVNASVT